MTNPVYASTTYLTGTGTDVLAAVGELATIGLDGIEIGSTHAPRPWARTAADIRELWPGAVVTHNYFPPAERELIVNLASADDGIRTASIAHAHHCLACAAEIGASVYTVHPGFLAEVLARAQVGADNYDFRFSNERSPRERAFVRMLRALETLAAEAQRLGVTLAVETEGSVTSADVLLLETPQEFERLFAELGDAVQLNLNLAHTALAARHHGYDMGEFIAQFASRFVFCELSHNDRVRDQHRPIPADSWVLDWLPRLPAGLPLVLEFRDASLAAVAESARTVRASLRAAVPQGGRKHAQAS
jgi:sugar phosphate isomerase/epimerase